MMILTPESFKFDCDCPRGHTVSIRRMIVEERALAGFTEAVASSGLAGTVTAIYDENTKAAVKEYGLRFDGEVVLSPENLHADETAVARAMNAMGKPDMLAAIGSGTIHDITRWCANALSIPFISCPTAASVDGFCSSVSAMTWYGYKKTMPGTAPALVIADLSVISKAPFYLTSSGVGDMVGKYTSLADWKIGHLLTGEDCCGGIVSLMSDALKAVTESVSTLAAGDLQAYEKLIFGLLLSGVAMQLSGNSRPASGAEHHISHFIEMGTLGENHSLHGEKVGVGTMIVADIYHKLEKLAVEEAARGIGAFAGVRRAAVKEIYGTLYDGVLEENKDECLRGVAAETVLENWNGITLVLREIPPVADIERILLSADSKTTLADIGADTERFKDIVHFSPFVRNRVTLMRVAAECGLLESVL